MLSPVTRYSHFADFCFIKHEASTSGINQEWLVCTFLVLLFCHDEVALILKLELCDCSGSQVRVLVLFVERSIVATAGLWLLGPGLVSPAGLGIDLKGNIV